MGLREQIREQSRFARMRLGQDAPEFVEVPSMKGVRIAMVPLNEAESQQGLIEAAVLEVPDNIAGINARNRAACNHDVWNACRMPDDVASRVWESVDDMIADTQPSDIDYLFDQLTVLADFASPSLAKLTEKEIEDLKKGFAAIDWKELTGRQASALVLCISRLLPELLQDKFFYSGSTPNSTTRSESEIST